MRYEANNIAVPKNGVTRARSTSFWREALLNKLTVPQVLMTLILTSCFIVYTMANGDMISGSLIVVGIVALIIVWGVLASAKFGVAMLLTSGYLLAVPGKLNINFPLGTLLDGLQYLLIIGFFFRQKMRKDFAVFKNPLSYAVLVWVLYNFAEIGNPNMVSAQAWLFTIRSTAVITLMYFIYVYEIQDVSFIKFIFKLWLGLAMIAALNGFHQEVFGFFPFEKQWLYSDPLRVELLFQGGHMRKFSIFADPVSFGYNMASAATLCIALIFGPYKTYKKVILGVSACFFLMTMMYSGTRGAFPLLPAAIVILAMLKFNRRVMVFSIIFAVVFVGLIFVPSSNQNIMRFQSAFRPNNDASYNLRKHNQALIRPYIQSHPMGGGLGTTGYWGNRFSPGTFLANFPPDSGYVRVAVESGTIGLLILCTLIFIALRTGINNYYLIKDPELKTMCLGMVMVIFVYNVANYPQEAFVQFPSNILFFFAFALINVTRNLDIKKQLEQNAQPEIASRNEE